MFKCKSCGHETQFRQNYLHHIQTGQPLQCIHCSFTFDSLCKLRSHRQSVHPKEFDESRKMMQNLEVAAKMSDRKNTSGESSGGSAAKTMGSISSSPRPSGAVSILVARTGEEETREQKPVSGFEQWCSPQSSKPRTPVGNNDQSPVSEPNGMETGDLIDVSIPDEDTCNIASAFKVLMDNVKNQSQPGEGETEVNKMIEQSVSADTTLMDSDHAKITVHNIGKAITPSHGQRTAESSHRSGMEAVETISARASHGSEVSGGYYVSQLENAALAKKNYHTTPVEGLEVAKAIDPSHTYKAFAIMQPEPTHTYKTFARMQPEPTGVGSVCYGCGDTFNSVVSLQLHQMANEHNYCKLCLSFFSDNSLFKFHIQKMHTFKCAACHLTFKDQEERMQHQRETGHAHCKDCSGYFLDQKSLSKHHEIHNRTKFSCPLCSSVFKTEMGRNAHQRDVGHAYCKSCICYFLDRKSFEKHIDCHQSTNGLVCPTYKLAHQTEKARTAHHKAVKHRKCPHRGEEFTDVASATKHAAINHTYQCLLGGCNIAFPTLDDLLVHHRKNHQHCKPCDRWFCDKAALESHEENAKRHM
ncbi:uncharacterized protein PADG_02070 [Paracoccidioides brasiliensis Pb18]|uniref:C2H2-type domain-containing protein n=1 Tax=Paracoccidioides brasiliensis (strain Pb18) TaxID=502780 RepID=C1G1Q4_PARBD|nr:uncharacterized protein PADG_02070 [Paracoccidioides brasiliensis Pb18]EEH45920.2 hypothetical protein PADG_02070 [Paracoccidioides brasiliensis Pb18]